MKLEVGKRYVRRDGSITDHLYFEHDHAAKRDYLCDGAFHFDDKDEENGWRVFSCCDHEGDLIEEYKEEGKE